MTWREIGFLLIGVGVGLLASAWFVVAALHHSFIFGVNGWLGWFAIASPAILMVLGTGLVFLGGGKKAYPRG